MAKNRFSIKGTKDFLVVAIVLIIFGLWCVKDGWFPSPKVLKKYPLERAIAFKVPGVIEKIPVKVGQRIEGKVLLAKLYEKSYREALEQAKSASEKAQAESSADLEKVAEQFLRAQENLVACTLYNTDFIQATSHGEEPLRGYVLEILAKSANKVDVLKTTVTGVVSRVTKEAVYVSPSGISEEISMPPVDEVEHPVPKGWVSLVQPDDAINEKDVLAGEPVLIMRPHDGFYLFNKVAAVLCLFLAVAALVFHWIASR
jgi:hypothetical protein